MTKTMVESMPPNPNSIEPPATAGDPPPPPLPPTDGGGGFLSLPRRPGIRLTTEFDSDSSIFFNKISCKLLDSLAKLKLSFQNNDKGEISEPQLALTSKYLSLHYDLEEHNALIKSSFDVGPALHLRAAHDVKVKTLWKPAGTCHGLDLGNHFFLIKFQEEADLTKVLSNGPWFHPTIMTLVTNAGEDNVACNAGTRVDLTIYSLLDGLEFLILQIMAQGDHLPIKHRDEQMAFIPNLSLPSNALSFAFKRRFGPSDKLRGAQLQGWAFKMQTYHRGRTAYLYWYNFDSNYWSTVYKHTVGKDYKFKVGYDSEVRLGWASLWVGDESGKAKTAPMKAKIQFMLQVPQDDIKSSALMFRVKKRWDI
ncbi:hypothetical protein TEA_006692 [Camellia sinensis var. sinensis]|uniref:DUF4283 domain-containing protein n=1 Tax=Camellia sinensis var. sinensis TaxID=542762 RepID=A0A4S4EAL7_CAMSN|nr:hypothetical protein TEA_006692 [Camellia sinensis var. sinensis]